jgi:hypothetical protein
MEKFKMKVKLTKKLMDYPHDCEMYEKGATVTNPFSEEKCYLPADALSVYDVIKGSEAQGKCDAPFSDGLDWFRKYYPDEYYVLLD